MATTLCGNLVKNPALRALHGEAFIELEAERNPKSSDHTKIMAKSMKFFATSSREICRIRLVGGVHDL